MLSSYKSLRYSINWGFTKVLLSSSGSFKLSVIFWPITIGLLKPVLVLISASVLIISNNLLYGTSVGKLSLW